MLTAAHPEHRPAKMRGSHSDTAKGRTVMAVALCCVLAMTPVVSHAQTAPSAAPSTFPSTGSTSTGVSPPCPGTANQIAANAAAAAANAKGAADVYVPPPANLSAASCFSTNWASYTSLNSYSSVLSSFLTSMVNSFVGSVTSAACTAYTTLVNAPAQTFNNATSSLLGVIDGAGSSLGYAAAAPIVNTAGAVTGAVGATQGAIVNGVSGTAQGVANSSVSSVSNAVGNSTGLTNYLTGK